MWPTIEIFGYLYPAYQAVLALGVLAGLVTLFFAARRKRVPLSFLADHFVGLTVVTALTARAVEMGLRGYGFLDFPFFWRDTGFSFFGGLFGFLAALAWFTRKNGESFFTWLDLTVLAGTVTLFFHHIGTLLAGSAYGKTTQLPWGIIFTHPDSAILTTLPLHPTQIYAAIVTLIYFLMATFVFKREQAAGRAGAFLLLALGFSSFGLDFLRDDSAPILFYIRAEQWGALAVVIFAVFCELRIRPTPKLSATHEVSLNETLPNDGSL